MMLTKLLSYLVLPAEVSAFERAYLHRMNRVALIFFLLHLPVFAAIAALNKTGVTLALGLTGLTLAGPVLAHGAFANPRHVARVSGFTAMVLGGLLVHFGQGPMQIEMHFYFFVVIALLAVFADPLVILIAAVTVATHHALLWALLPRSVFNYDASIWTVAVHALFVVLESAAACFVARSFFDNVIGLDRIVTARTAQLDERNRDLRLVLDNVGEGFLTIGLDGTMSQERSAILTTWLGVSEGSEPLWDYLGRVDPSVGARLAFGWEAVIEDALPLELTLEQLPRRFSAGERTLSLGYRPIFSGERLDRLLVVISDLTPAIERERSEAEQREIMVVFERVLRDRAGFLEFFAESTEMTRALTGGEVVAAPEVNRLLHTLKGNCAMFGLLRFSELCHDLEDRVLETGELGGPDRARLDEAYQALATKLGSLLGDAQPGGLEVADEDYAAIIRAIARGTPRAEVLRLLDEWKLEPADRRLGRLADQARAAARRLGKGNVSVVVHGNGVRLPHEDWSGVWAATVHAIRNAVDHGLEAGDERTLSGKEQLGQITLSATRSDGSIVVTIEDDGRGVDWNKIAEKARHAGLPAATTADLEAALFADGVSTRDVATQFSGRGVGMGALQSACQALGGAVHVRSEPGKGTRLELHLPAPVPAPRSMPPRSLPSSALAGSAP
jgi:two-component system chemotaxis sensor kinase CheA